MLFRRPGHASGLTTVGPLFEMLLGSPRLIMKNEELAFAAVRSELLSLALRILSPPYEYGTGTQGRTL